MALGGNWTEAVKQFSRGMIQEWVSNQIYDQQLTSTLTDVAEDSRLQPDMKLAVALLALNPQLPLSWKGDVVSPEWMPNHVPSAVPLLTSAVPEWVAELRQERWLLELRLVRERVVARVRAAGVAYDSRLADQLA